MAGRHPNHLPDLVSALNPVRHLKVVGRLVRPTGKRPGTAPGTIVHTGLQRIEEVKISIFDYDAVELREQHDADVSACLPLRDTPTMSWIDIVGLHDVDLIRSLGEHFGLHPLVLEDIAHVGQRPKMEEYEEYLYLVLHMLTFDDEVRRVNQEQSSLVVGENFVLSFQERVGDLFEPVRERLRSGKGTIRARGSDYLAYALIDAVVDGYYTVLEQAGDEIEELDEQVITEPERDTLNRIHELKREMLVIRRGIWPMREVTSQLIRSEHPRVSEGTTVYLRDVYDHSVQIMDTVDTLRDLSSSLTDLYLSAMGHRQNEVMKVLTIMASIFIPLTFLAGIYGMNFAYMPELDVRWGYPVLLGVMGVVAGAMLWYFRRKGWL